MEARVGNSEGEEKLTRIPAMNRLLDRPAAREAATRWSREEVVLALRELTAEVREAVRQGQKPPATLKEWDGLLLARLERRLKAHNLRRVVNATGIILHTNLGRAVLAPSARTALAEIGEGYSNLEFDLESGERGSRHAHVAGLLAEITGAEAGLVVNNGAAAVLLVLDTLAAGREVVVSRGQLVEIGGAFRIPDVLAKSGARLVEVGTTNKTRLSDYERALTPETALLLKVHTSNFRVIGFTEQVSLAELVSLGRERGLPVVEDLGSGVLVDLTRFGLLPEPIVQHSVAAGADLVTFSGDKLLGGTQAGIIVGRAEYVQRLARNPLMRALRVDKLTLSALEATLRLYRDPEVALREIPTLAMLARPADAVKAAAERLAARIRETLGERAQVEVVEDAAEAGGGSLPGTTIPSWAAALIPRPGLGSLEECLARLRRAEPPVIAHLAQDRLLFNLRTVLPGEEELILAALSTWR
ncbi:MAG TPA: L-seryl-tRNA(Sec) selenium transferase [Firmicutes bacterium]|nr:L-seryl-tRNA(Sec) selenium transferase [Bacillota bacterium]